MSEQGIIRIHNKDYKTVALRVTEFRADFANMSLETDIVSNLDGVVIIKAWISDEEGRVIATGYAEEIRGSTNINKTSALENCETSAIGRALACFGLGGEHYASANEVTNAILQQEIMAATEKVQVSLSNLKLHQEKVREHFASVAAIKEYLLEVSGGVSGGDEFNNMGLAMEAWFEIPISDRRILALAPSKGGIFTPFERGIVCGQEFTAEHIRRVKEGLEKPQTVEDYENGN